VISWAIDDLRQMVKFVVSQQIQAIIQEYNTFKNLAEQDEGYVNPSSVSIQHLQLVHIAEYLQASAEATEKSQYTLNNILRNTSIYIEPIKKPPPVSSFLTFANDRIQSTKQGWKLSENDSSNKNIRPWSPIFNPLQGFPFSPMRHIPPKMQKWSKTSCLPL
jgi:hypothetical protein